jgi:hypothetical protein
MHENAATFKLLISFVYLISERKREREGHDFAFT